MEPRKENKKALLAGLGKAISSAIRPSMYIESIPSNSSALKTRIYDCLSQDLRIEAFDTLTSLESDKILIADYIDSVLYASRFLLANKLNNECYLFLTVCQSRIQSIYGSPFDYTLTEEIGNMFYLTKNYQDAIRCYERLLLIGERNPAVIHFNIGVCYQEMGNYSGAIQYYLKSINLDSGFVKAAIGLGLCYQTLGQYEKAIGTFKQLPDSPESFTCMGNAYYSMKNYEEAVNHYLRAINLNPTAGAYNNLGAALKKAGFLQDAIFAFSDSLAIESTGDTVANLIALYIEVGKLEDAEKLYQNSKKFLSQHEIKFFTKLISEKMDKVRRATMIMAKALSPSKHESTSLSPVKDPSPNIGTKIVNIFSKNKK